MLMAFTHQLIIIYYEGVTTVLTMTFLGLEARTDLPQVSYPTALDYFVFISFMFIFSTVVQVWNKNMLAHILETKFGATT